MLRIRKALAPTPPMKSPLRITAVRKPFDPEAFAAVLVAAALARLAEQAERGKERSAATKPNRRKAA